MESFVIFRTSLASLESRYLVRTVLVHVLFRCWSRRDLGFGRGHVHVHFLGRKFPSPGRVAGVVGVVGCWLSGVHTGWVVPVALGAGCSPRWGSACCVSWVAWLVVDRYRRQLVCCSSMVRFACRHCFACREESLRSWPLPKIFFGLFSIILSLSFWLVRICACQRVS